MERKSNTCFADLKLYRELIFFVAWFAIETTILVDLKSIEFLRSNPRYLLFRFCQVTKVYVEPFMNIFADTYSTVHRSPHY